MIVCGVESTAHTFGVGIIKDKTILANQKASFSTEKGGIIPMEAAKHHEANWRSVFDAALKETKLKPEDNSLVAYSRGPGMGPCLRVGLKAAEYIAKKAALSPTLKQG